MTLIGRFQVGCRRVVAFLGTNWPAATALVVLAFVGIAVSAISRDGSHAGRMWLALCGLVLVVLMPRNRPGGERRQRIYWGVVAAACLFGAFNYYQFDRRMLTEVRDVADATYYYVNSKYFSELGYFRLYPAMLLADQEGERSLLDVKKYRDLDSYKLVRRNRIERVREDVLWHFSPKRWESFVHDVGVLVNRGAAGGWSYFFSDHGYNPPPPWTLVGGTFSRLVSVERLKWIASIDFLLVLAMFAVIIRVMGWRAAAIVMLFACCTFSGRWPVLGQALLRFDWLAALVMSACLFQSGRGGWSGGLLAYAGLTRVFPLVFFFPPMVEMFRRWRERRRPDGRDLRFVVGAAGTASAMLALSLVVLGPGAFKESARNLAMHGGADSYSSHRVGLGDALFYRGETTRAEMREHGGIQGKSEQIRGAMPWLLGAMALSLLGIAAVVLRSGPLHLGGLPLAAIPLFCATNAQINYWNLRILLVLWHMSAPDRLRNRLGLALLFAIEAVAQYTKVAGHARYSTTTLTSVGLCVYFAVLIGFLVQDALAARRR